MYQERAAPFAPGFNLNVSTGKLQEADASAKALCPSEQQPCLREAVNKRTGLSCMGIQKPAEYDPNTHAKAERGTEEDTVTKTDVAASCFTWHVGHAECWAKVWYCNHE